MTKMQKVWLGIFLAMFIVPEVLWSPIYNEIYAFFMPLEHGSVQIFRQNFLVKIDNINYLSGILLIQLIGLLLSFIYLIMARGQLQNKVLFYSCAIILFLLALVAFCAYSLSLSIRNIGL